MWGLVVWLALASKINDISIVLKVLLQLDLCSSASVTAIRAHPREPRKDERNVEQTWTNDVPEPHPAMYSPDELNSSQPAMWQQERNACGICPWVWGSFVRQNDWGYSSLTHLPSPSAVTTAQNSGAQASLSLWISGTWEGLPSNGNISQTPSFIPVPKLQLYLELLKLQIFPPSWTGSPSAWPCLHTSQTPFLPAPPLPQGFLFVPLLQGPGSQKAWRWVWGCSASRPPFSSHF